MGNEHRDETPAPGEPPSDPAGTLDELDKSIIGHDQNRDELESQDEPADEAGTDAEEGATHPADVHALPVGRPVGLAGRRVLITGPARGIGAATARELAGRGARLALVGLEPDALAALADDLPAVSGGEHIWVQADVADQAELPAAVQHAAAVMGGLDVVVANAGVLSLGTAGGIDPEVFARIVDVNVIGVFRTVHAGLPYLTDSGGYVLLVSSTAAVFSPVSSAAYGASKSAVEALADALRIEVARLGVTVGCAYLSWVDTDMLRDAERELPSFRAMRRGLPWPLRATMPVADCAAALADAIEARRARVGVPAAIGLARWIRPVLRSRLLDVLTTWRLSGLLARMDAEASRVTRALHRPREASTSRRPR